ncbi:uncharacterized protein LDX57_011157 [Aspergillus melleus]|uniref:uncharacterized protein n=1 Tax=Aspergillus melleus TaxID=138277 RepID=UPI001E8E497C|nr:uncharacterized protein LDX57_011157 [Aspergillus melleus]KAH8433523.1 hypothetical protein LDX57_011157 [Aspergillus melleus]
MCQLIIFWHTCSHLILTSLKCPFDGCTTHEEETTTTALVDYPCYLCKQGPDHPQWERVSRVRSAILTVEHMECILDVSCYDNDFLARVAGFYARGDHKRWGQPGEDKAKYTQKDYCIESLELEVALAAREEMSVPTSPGLMFDLEFALAKRFDLENLKTLFWPLKGWREPGSAFYSASTMLGLMPAVGEQGALKMTACDGDEIYGCSTSATSLSLCQTNNTWNTSFPETASSPATDWIQLQDNNHMPVSVSEAQGPLISDKLFGFDAYGLNGAILPDLCSAVQMIDMGTPTPASTVLQDPVESYQMTEAATAIAHPHLTYHVPANGANISYSAGDPYQVFDTSLPAPPGCDILPFGYGYTTPVLQSRPMSSNASTSMSPMSPQRCPTEQQQQQQQDQPISTQNPFGYGSSHQFLSALIPMYRAQAQTQAQAQTLAYQALPVPLSQQLQSQQPQAQPNHQTQPRIPTPSPKRTTRKPRLSGSNLFRSHGPPNERYLTPLPYNPATPVNQMYETPDETTFSTPVMSTKGLNMSNSSDVDMDMNTDTNSESPSPSTRRRKRTITATVTPTPTDKDQMEASTRKTAIPQLHGPFEYCALVRGGNDSSGRREARGDGTGGGIGLGIANLPSQDHGAISAPSIGIGIGSVSAGPGAGPVCGLGVDPVPMMMMPMSIPMSMPRTPQRVPVPMARTPVMTQSTSIKNVNVTPGLSGGRKRKRDHPGGFSG